MVVYADRFVPEAEKAKARETGEDAKAVPFLKRFTVFNVAQCEGLRPETGCSSWRLAPSRWRCVALPIPTRRS